MKTLLITGGAGFIGTNTVDYFASAGWKVIVLDNLSRKGSEDNLSWIGQKIILIINKGKQL